jgi:hypothetical protein
VNTFSVTGPKLNDGKAIPPKDTPLATAPKPTVPAKPAPKPAPAPAPAPGQQPKDCSQDFMMAYRDLVMEIGKLNEAIKAGKTPDVATAVKACDSIETKHANVVCRVNDPEIQEKPTIATKDAESVCQQIRTIAAKSTPTQPAPKPAPGGEVKACTKDYLEAYVGIASKIDAVAQAVQKRDLDAVRAALPAARAACSSFAKDQAGAACMATNGQTGEQQKIETNDFKEDCATIETLAGNLARQPGEPAQPPAPTGDKAMCTKDYIESYIKAMQTLQTFGKYYQAGQPAPNVPEALAACRGMTKQYPTTACQVQRPGSNKMVDLATADFERACGIVEKVAKDGGHDTGKPGEKKAVTDASAIAEIEASRMKFAVLSTEFQKAAEQPKAIYFIEGKALSLQESLDSEAAVRCTIDRMGSKPLQLPIGKQLTGKSIEEAFASDIRTSKIQFNEDGLSLECSSTKKDRLTLGDLKAALKGILDIIVGE